MEHSYLPSALLALAVAPSLGAAQAPPLTFESQELFPGAPLGEFGRSVALQGDVLVVGAPLDQQAAAHAGTAHVYRHVGGAWTLEDTWFPTNPSNADFGRDVAISGDRVVVGAPFEAAPTAWHGAVYVHVWNGAQWTLEQRLTQTIQVDPELGTSVAIDGDLLVAGAPAERVGGALVGAAYVWRRQAGGWVQEAALFPSDAPAVPFPSYGSAVAVEGDTIAVGSIVAPGHSADSGAVYVYQRQGGAWVETAKLVGSLTSPGASLSHFGGALDLDAGRLVIGSYFYNGVGPSSGLVFEYRELGGTWTQTARLEASDSRSGDEFGYDVALDGTRLLIGAHYADTSEPDTGAAYLYEEVGGTWLERAKLAGSDASFLEHMGVSVALDGARAVVGAFRDQTVGFSAGEAYAFDVALPAPVGTAYCFGDGSGTACPCGNASAPGAGQGCRNSTGQGAWLELVGSASVSAADLAPYVHHLPQQQTCILFAGVSASNRGAGIAFGDGLRCADTTVVRLGIGFGNETGVASWAPMPKLAGVFSPGRVLRFQVWYHDATGGPCGQLFNLSNAVELTLTP